ncbi:MAG: tripartite tricarboxylate transporter TctB family protein [Desulfovibrio sp.]|jgi:hypothetical protein|nr:tripartite tricarboxylate transporter TctB family protein [Desulfovibrio sp.]
MRKSTSDLVAAVFALALSGLFFLNTGDLEGTGLNYPLLILAFMVLCVLALIFSGLRARQRAEDGEARIDAEPVAVKRVLIISAASLLYAIFIPILGFYAASALFLFGAAMVLNESKVRRLKAACLLTAIMCLAVWAAFAKLLGVPTPEGLFY